MVLLEHPWMEDFNGLASSLAAGVDDVRGCLILSRDGLVLGAHPQDGEAKAKPAWMRFAALGDPERGFAQFGTDTWCYVRRGPYAAFAVVGPGARPGLIIDHMEQVLLAAEETRASREGVRAEPAGPAPTSKPRTPLHPERPLEEPVIITADVAPAIQAASGSGEATPPAADPTPEAAPPAPAPPEPPREQPQPAPVGPDGPPAEPAPAGPDGPQPEPAPAPAGAPGDDWTLGGGEDDDVDRFSLAREFGQLLQDDEDGADG